MANGKFDTQKDGQYWINYFILDKYFYDAIKKHIDEDIPNKNTVGIDIGSGPGVGARILADLNFETELTGFEPSETFHDGERLSNEFIKQSIPIKYNTKQGGILDINTPNINSFDYILILRATHEIAESLGNKNKFFSELGRILVGLRSSGILIIAEPQYCEENPSEEIIKEVQVYQQKSMGHFHIPSDYITAKDMKNKIENIGLKLIKETILPNSKLLDHLKKRGLNLNNSPCNFYVQTFQKMME